MSSLLSLPDDLLVHEILSRVQISSLAACRATCRQLNALIKGSTLLTYLEELQIAEMVDNPKSSHSLVERLTLLREREMRWLTFNFKWRKTVEIPYLTSESAFTLTGGIYMVGKGLELDSDPVLGLYCTSLPLEEDKEASWDEINLGKNILYFIYREDQDLVICVTYAPRTPLGSVLIQACLYQYSNRVPHPAATSPVLDVCVMESKSALPPFQMDAGICGNNLIVVLYDGDQFTGRLYLYNWRTGVKRGELAISTPKLGLSFLREDLLMHGNMVNTSLDVYQVLPTSQEENSDTSECFRLLHCFGLPEIAPPAFRYTTIEVSSGAATGGLYPPMNAQAYPFVCDHLRTIVIVTIEVQETSFILITHRETMLDCLLSKVDPSTSSINFKPPVAGEERPTPTIPWREWGPRTSRFLELSEGVSHPSSATGTRYAIIEYDRVELLDFGRTKIAFHRAHDQLYEASLEEDLVTVELVDRDAPTVIPKESGPFMEDISTNLPYIRSTYLDSDVQEGGIFGLDDVVWEGILMDDSYLVGFREPLSKSNGYRVEELDVLYFT